MCVWVVCCVGCLCCVVYDVGCGVVWCGVWHGVVMFVVCDV